MKKLVAKNLETGMIVRRKHGAVDMRVVAVNRYGNGEYGIVYNIVNREDLGQMLRAVNTGEQFNILN